MNIIIFGAPGAGKGTQSELVAQKANMLHINAGAELRKEVANNTMIGKVVDPLMKAGNLVPESMVIGAIRPLLDKNRGNNLIFDGYPRSISQANYLYEIMDEYNSDIQHAIFLDVPDEILLERLFSRKREDDTEEIIKHRLNVYKQQTAPLIEYFEDKWVYSKVDGVGSVEEITERIMKVINEN